MRNKIYRGYLVVLAGLGLAVGASPAREFEDAYGRVIEAELVSHTGADGELVTINKGGKELTVKVGVFSEEDQKFIRDWMRKTPPTLDYAFRVDASKSAGEAAGARSEKVAYEIKVTNLTREPVSGMRVEYRAYFLDQTGQGVESGLRKWAAARFGKRAVDRTVGKAEPVLKHVEGTVPIEGPLRFNQTATFTTEALRIDEARKGRFSTGYKDELVGVIVRVYEPGGKLVFEHRDKKTADYEWGGEGEDAAPEVTLD